MPRRSRTFASLLAGALVLAVSGCGSSSSPAPKPSVGAVVAPTSANAFMWLPRSVVKEPNGNLLIADSGNWDRTGAKIVELSPGGKPVWIYSGGMDFPHSAYRMPDGDVIISDTGNDRVIEVNHKGKIVWNTDNLGGGNGNLGQGKLSNGVRLLYPNDAYPMANGDILISSRYTNAVYEVNKAGQVKWSCARFMNRQHNPRMLPDGSLIVADSDNARGLIINHACNKILFQYGPAFYNGAEITWPRSFQPYGNNYILGDSNDNRILEVNRRKQVVRQWTNLPAPFYVTVLKNGDLLTQDSNIHGAVELGPNGDIVKQWATRDPNTYPANVVNPGFESPGGWRQGDLLTETLPAGVRADMKLDSSQARSGKSSAMISWPTDTGHLNLFWFQTVSVTPGKTYNFSGWIKTDKVQPCTGCSKGTGTSNYGDALFQIIFFDPTSATTPPTSFAVATDDLGNTASGTQDWTRQTAQFTVPRGVTQVQIQAILRGRGTAWFDDVSLK